MRLLKRRVRAVPIYAPTEQPGDYVGVETIWDEASVIHADVQPAENSLLAAEYGERVKNMLTLYTDKSANVQTGYGAFSLRENGEPAYKVVQVSRYESHIVIVVEAKDD